MYGAEAVILNMSRTLNEGSHASVLGVFSNSSNPNLQLHEVALKEDIESHVIPCEGQIDPTVFASIRNLATRTNADVVHAHGYKADIYSYFALRGSSIPLVSTCHTWYDNNRLVTLYGKADRLVLRSYTAVIAVSDEVKQRLLKAGVREDKIHLIRNGIDLRPFDNTSPSLPNAVGEDIFLHAAAHVLAEFPSTNFVVVGEGPDRDKLESLIDSLKLGQSVAMLGRREDMPSVYASLDIMVSASRQEGLPMAILEGMASSLPIIATPVGDVPAMVRDGQTGVMVPPENAASLAAAIVSLLRDPTRRERLGNAARKLIEDEFSADRMTADYLRVYQEAVYRGSKK